jgi:nifR3 family TIM-barrel protein
MSDLPTAERARDASRADRGVPLARPGEFAPLALGRLSVSPPIVLAPMAGVTNYPFRCLAREFGAGLYVSEMITARGYLNGNRRTELLASSRPDEKPRSVQVYTSDPRDAYEIVARLAGEGVDHVDLNLGCPVRKVTAHGGGAAIPLKPRLMARIVGAMVSAARGVPVTVKVRKGIDDSLPTYVDSGRVAEAEGASAIGLHARTAAQLYAGEADWRAIAELKARVSIPVLGNGDVWTADDALAMLAETSCDGVVVGRGCLGRPWLFGELADAFAAPAPRPARAPTPGAVPEPASVPAPGPTSGAAEIDGAGRPFGAVRAIMDRHVRMLVAWRGDEWYGVREFRKHLAWYTKGYRFGREVRAAVGTVHTVADLDAVLDRLDPAALPRPGTERLPRAKGSGRQRVALPDGYLDDLEDATPPDDAGYPGSGG